MGDKQHLIINGSGSYGGGRYNKVKIRGEGTITTDFECDEFKTFGSSDILKNGKAQKFDVFGETQVRGNIITEELKVFGTLKVGGTAEAGKANVLGSLEIGDRFTCEEADIKGSLSVKGDAEFEKFHSTGEFQITGLLNADEVVISLRFGTSKAAEIGGEKIQINRKPLLAILRGDGFLEAGVIEGDEISLENTKADVVRGKKVHIGQGCEIGLVEYQEEYKADPAAMVKEKKKIG
jgi:cytoskeletal protein CcmA (bactofilin family)